MTQQTIKFRISKSIRRLMKSESFHFLLIFKEEMTARQDNFTKSTIWHSIVQYSGVETTLRIQL